MLPVLRVLSALAPIVAMAFVRTDRRLVETLRGAGAAAPSTAVPLPATNALTRWRRSRLMGAGAIRDAGNERYYFDPAGYVAYRWARRRRAMVLFAVVGLVVLAVWAFR